MITAAITAAIVWVLNIFGIPPGPYIAGIAIGVKIALVSIIAFIGWRVVRKRRAAESATAADQRRVP